MKLNNFKFWSNTNLKKKYSNIYFKKRTAHLFKNSKFLNRYYSKLNQSAKNQFNYKLPILTCIELVQASNVPPGTQNNHVLYNDYLLISSKTKYKYLLRTLYEQVNLDFKDNYTIVDGFLQIKNWEPVSLNSISSIKQCFKFEAKNEADKHDQCESTDVNSKETNNGETENTEHCQIKESLDICSSPMSQSSHRNEKNAPKASINVYDILSHVVSFATIRIMVKSKDLVNMQSQTMEDDSGQEKISNQDDGSESNDNLEEDKETRVADSPILSTAPNFTSMLYSSPQFASLLPLFNLPIITQLLNGIKSQQEKKDFTSFTEDLKSEPDNQFNQQPLNLCKDAAKNVNSKKVTQNLSVSTNKIQNNIGVDNASPSPSLSTTSSTSSSSSCAKNLKHTDSTHTLNSKCSKEQIVNEQLKNFPSQSQIRVSYGNRRQRERTTFDPQEEITRLMQVFERTHHPTRFQIANICEFLNSLGCRKDKKPLEPYNIQYWFKNARAALRRKVKGDSQNSNFELNSKVANTVKDDEFLNKVLNTRPTSHSLGSKFTDNNEINGDTSDQNYEDSNLDDDELNDDEETNLKIENCDSYYEYQNSESENGFNKNNDKENLENIENSACYEDCEYQDDLSYDGEENNQEIANNSASNLGINATPGAKNRNPSNGSRRNRVFIDPISEVPILEHYFSIETYPDHYLIEKICENLNKGEYRYKFPKLESRNIQLWFKNHRAKLKRLKTNPSSSSFNQNQSNPVS
ncbi:DNA-binding SATB2 [Brachionus plicatilis]|uniref:DNA-binding SATB2 n=1 Tax=Brachionus plicatilis TaxID=10195 RepID=A0A3M7T332_BRAPC|nr:DNA-binding SATB2 [Brachionus plicatilis]